MCRYVEAKTKLEFYLGCFLPSVPKCAFVGGCFGFAAVPRIAELQSKAVVGAPVHVENPVDPLGNPIPRRITSYGSRFTAPLLAAAVV